MKGNKKTAVLVIAGPYENWYKLCKPYEDSFCVEQACWNDISLTVYPSGPVVHLQPTRHPIDDKQKESRTIEPDLVVVRMLCRSVGERLGITPDYRNVLYGFVHAFIPQTYYSEAYEMVISPSVPFVVKYSYPHGGYGKIRVRDNSDFPDVRSIVAVNNHYCSAEPFIDQKYEVRIIFIAPDYIRARKRFSPNWKINFGSSNYGENIKVPDRYKRWVQEIHNTYPGFDTFCLDVIVDKNEKEYILEMGGSSQGFSPEYADEALAKLRDLVVTRVKDLTKN
ncbi:synapsin-2-like isoform X1 [Histomonas meleagridis]|uniref:synapsin-2-like isoform X1 n=1 Tax=Histomonas meleagridis TaxID=135588 RepID=UPI00355A229C|nr:synapsin-2-like isoform X1 [Histomonas meleagridis]KAH0805409.1 synapsin-2-like isoform X1 [Histomonas meleagridis]